MTVITAAVSRSARLLSARPALACRRGGVWLVVGVGVVKGGVGRRGSGRVVWELIGSRARLGGASEVLLAQESELSFEIGDTFEEGLLACGGTLMHGLPVAGLLTKGKKFGVKRAGVTGGRVGGWNGQIEQGNLWLGVPRGRSQRVCGS